MSFMGEVRWELYPRVAEAELPQAWLLMQARLQHSWHVCRTPHGHVPAVEKQLLL